MATKKKTLLIVGDPSLVVEYAGAGLHADYRVFVRMNNDGSEGNRASRLPRGVRVVTTIPKGMDIALELTNISMERKHANLQQLGKALRPAIPLLSSSVTLSVTEQTAWVRHPDRLVGLGALPTLLGATLVELADHGSTSERAHNAAAEFVRSIGKTPVFVRDTVGMVMPRILCSLANEACFAVMEEVASAEDIDTAMKLGTNYPAGPIEWLSRIGPRHVLSVLDGLRRYFGEDRYRAAPLLRRAAAEHHLSLLGGAPQT